MTERQSARMSDITNDGFRLTRAQLYAYGNRGRRRVN